MKKVTLFTLALVSLFTANAKADGFVCRTLENDLRISVYNHVNAQNGTRVGAIMVLSDPRVAPGYRTIATFENTNSLLENQGARYVAKVDLRYRNSNLGGRNVSGTKLGFIDTVVLDVFFLYSQPTQHGEISTGQLFISKRDGSRIYRNAECKRYLKNPAVEGGALY